jgi:hypothetical protein
MRFDKEKLEALAALPDDALWAEVIRIADSFGYCLPRETPPHSELQKMRDAVKGGNINATSAIRLVNQLKRM